MISGAVGRTSESCRKRSRRSAHSSLEFAAATRALTGSRGIRNLRARLRGRGSHHGRCQYPCPRARWGRDHVRTCDHGDDLRRWTRVRCALQPRSDVRVRPHTTLPLAARHRLLGRAACRRVARRRAAALVAREHRACRSNAACRVAGAVVPVGSGDDGLPDVRHPRRGHGHARGGRGSRHRDRRNSRTGRNVRRPNFRCVDEPRPLDWTGGRLRRAPRALALHRRASRRRVNWRTALPGRTRATRTRTRHGSAPRRGPRSSID